LREDKIAVRLALLFEEGSRDARALRRLHLDAPPLVVARPGVIEATPPAVRRALPGESILNFGTSGLLASTLLLLFLPLSF
jgi:hypothetical protein